MANVNFDVSYMRRCGCKECGCTEFTQEYKFFEIPEVLRFAANGDDIASLTPNPDIYTCKECGALQTLKEMIKLASFRDLEKAEEKVT
jgi:hypothetical protein